HPPTPPRFLTSFPTRRSSDLVAISAIDIAMFVDLEEDPRMAEGGWGIVRPCANAARPIAAAARRFDPGDFRRFDHARQLSPAEAMRNRLIVVELDREGAGIDACSLAGIHIERAANAEREDAACGIVAITD